MAAPSSGYHFNIEIAKQAALRWKSRESQRDSKVAAADKGEYTKAESKERLVKHVNRLLGAYASVTASSAAGTMAREALEEEVPEVSDLVRHGEVGAADINNHFVERVIGKTRDFLAIQFFDRGTVASRAVCRIVTDLADGKAFGTGFLVTPSLLLTNHHVLDTPAHAMHSVAEFNYQVAGTNAVMPIETFRFDPDSFFLTDEGLDFTLVALARRSARGTPLSSFGYCPLIGAEGKIIIGQPVNVIQHPKGELKQVVIRENKLLDLPDKEAQSNIDQYAHYEADTEPGSSGSPVFNDQWEVVALHHSGIPRINTTGQALDRDGKVWPPNGDPDQIDWVANEGIRTSRLAGFISHADVGRGRPLLDEFIRISRGEIGMPPVITNPERQTPVPIDTPTPPSVSANVDQNGTISITVPLIVTIGLGAPAQAAAAPAAFAVDTLTPDTVFPPGDVLESGKPDSNYGKRPGFDPNFLGFAAPLPKLAPAVKNLAVKVGSGIELKYYHYSVIMNSARKLAFVSAVNLDVGAKYLVKREGKDHWYYDDRISYDVQAGPELYANNPLDFGHLTRRQDAAWGATEKAAEAANDDTFHLTNCSPQHEVFNQSSKASHNGLLLWGNLEMYVTGQAKKDSKKLSIFNGPVFRGSDRDYRGIQLPREFWKLIVYLRDNGKPGAVAFVLSQESLIRNLPAEEFVVGPYKPYQLKVSDLEKRTNLDFGAIEKFDAMHTVRPESLMEGLRTAIVPIETFADIVI